MTTSMRTLAELVDTLDRLEITPTTISSEWSRTKNRNLLHVWFQTRSDIETFADDQRLPLDVGPRYEDVRFYLCEQGGLIAEAASFSFHPDWAGDGTASDVTISARAVTHEPGAAA